MNEIQWLRHFIDYVAYDPARTSLSEEEHNEWVRGVLRYCNIGLYSLVYDSMEDDLEYAKELVDEMVADLSILVPLQPGDGDLPPEGTLQDEIKHQMESLLDRLEERQEEMSRNY